MLQVLTEKHMLTAAEEWDLIEQLRFAPEDAWLQTLYRWVPQQQKTTETRSEARHM